MLLKAKEKNCEICISLKKGEILKGISLFVIASAKDELFNYVLFARQNKPFTLRLSTINNVVLTQKTASISPWLEKLFKKQIASSVQFPIYHSQNDVIKVKLTPKGQDLFKRIYLYRPTPLSIDGDIYTFDCSNNQILYYFKRFGDTAVILIPKRLGIEMQIYYKYALRNITNITNTKL